MIARIEETDKSHLYYLIVENVGSGHARKIMIYLDDKPIAEHPSNFNKNKNPEDIGPHSLTKWYLCQTSDRRLPSKIAINWEDASGQPGKYTTTL